MALSHLINHSSDSITTNSLRIALRCFAKSSSHNDEDTRKPSQNVTANRIIGVAEILPDLRANLFKQFTHLNIFDTQSSACNSYPFLSVAKYSVPVVRERAQAVSKLVGELNYPPERITLRLVNRFIFWQKLLGYPPMTGKAAEIIGKVSDTARVKAKVKALAKIDNQLRRNISGEEIDKEILLTKQQLENEISQLKESLLDQYHMSQLDNSFGIRRDNVNK